MVWNVVKKTLNAVRGFQAAQFAKFGRGKAVIGRRHLSSQCIRRVRLRRLPPRTQQPGRYVTLSPTSDYAAFDFLGLFPPPRLLRMASSAIGPAPKKIRAKAMVSKVRGNSYPPLPNIPFFQCIFQIATAMSIRM